MLCSLPLWQTRKTTEDPKTEEPAKKHSSGEKKLEDEVEATLASDGEEDEDEDAIFADDEDEDEDSELATGEGEDAAPAGGDEDDKPLEE